MGTKDLTGYERREVVRKSLIKLSSAIELLEMQRQIDPQNPDRGVHNLLDEARELIYTL